MGGEKMGAESKKDEEYESRGVEKVWTPGERTERRGEKNQSRGGCGEVPRPAAGSAVRMINGN